VRRGRGEEGRAEREAAAIMKLCRTSLSSFCMIHGSISVPVRFPTNNRYGENPILPEALIS
jgi:hypothetical protein